MSVNLLLVKALFRLHHQEYFRNDPQCISKKTRTDCNYYRVHILNISSNKRNMKRKSKADRKVCQGTSCTGILHRPH
ncbi:hypothetical protein FRX31_035385 [Thalictrum thalictroides]|uniref:Uncharacterized protein n=1 Tax=Thalictrum thalictroides TaxID=46969 RepID=A0A7J6UR65_THATH|nr:hypothetical protein FRX31_035385 [Thalictrum thalictroides]